MSTDPGLFTVDAQWPAPRMALPTRRPGRSTQRLSASMNCRCHTLFLSLFVDSFLRRRRLRGLLPLLQFFVDHPNFEQIPRSSIFLWIASSCAGVTFFRAVRPRPRARAPARPKRWRARHPVSYAVCDTAGFFRSNFRAALFGRDVHLLLRRIVRRRVRKLHQTSSRSGPGVRLQQTTSTRSPHLFLVRTLSPVVPGFCDPPGNKRRDNHRQQPLLPPRPPAFHPNLPPPTPVSSPRARRRHRPPHLRP